MQKKKNILTVFFLYTCICGVYADYKSDIYNAFISNDMKIWKQTIDKMSLESTKSDDFTLELVNYQYGYIGWCLGVKRKKEAERYLSLAEKNIKILESRSFKPSYTNSYKSAFYGFRISLNALKSPVYGPKSIHCAELAISIDKTNPLGYIQYGNCLYYMPEAFGGSKTKAMEYYLKALSLFESENTGINKDWNYLSLLVIIGNAYMKAGDKITSQIYYDKALAAEPGIMWIRERDLQNLID